MNHRSYKEKIKRRATEAKRFYELYAKAEAYEKKHNVLGRYNAMMPRKRTNGKPKRKGGGMIGYNEFAHPF